MTTFESDTQIFLKGLDIYNNETARKLVLMRWTRTSPQSQNYNDDEPLPKESLDSTSVKLEELKSGGAPHPSSHGYHNLLDLEWRSDFDDKFHYCQEAIKQEVHELIQVETLPNQSRLRYEREQEIDHLEELIHSQFNHEIEGLHRRVKDCSNQKAESQERTRRVLLQKMIRFLAHQRSKHLETHTEVWDRCALIRLLVNNQRILPSSRKSVQRNFEFLEWDADR